MNDRIVPRPTVTPVELHSHRRRTSAQDQSLVARLSHLLHRDGVLGDGSDEVMGDAELSFSEMFDRAAAQGKSERELNPDYYRPEVEEIVSRREAEREDWENPDIPPERPHVHNDEFEAYLSKANHIVHPRINRGGEDV